jgi:hypothetical protein
VLAVALPWQAIVAGLAVLVVGIGYRAGRLAVTRAGRA